jgi:hypothetical protein
MKPKYGAAILILAFSMILCQKGTDNYRSEGIILGPDFRDCACCGGWYIKIDTTEYEFDTLPQNTDIDLQGDPFPINVKLDWQLSSRIPCPDKWVVITRIKKD